RAVRAAEPPLPSPPTIGGSTCLVPGVKFSLPFIPSCVYRVIAAQEGSVTGRWEDNRQWRIALSSATETKGAGDEGQSGRFPGGQGDHRRAARSAWSDHGGPLGRRIAAVRGAVVGDRPRRHRVSGPGRTHRDACRAGSVRRAASIAVVAHRTIVELHTRCS